MGKYSVLLFFMVITTFLKIKKDIVSACYSHSYYIYHFYFQKQVLA